MIQPDRIPRHSARRLFAPAGAALPFAVAVALAGAGCGAGSGLDDDGSMVLDAGDVQLLGTSDSLAVVRDLEVLENGEVWVLNSVEPLFLGFDEEGELLAGHGRRGGGPEEFGRPAGLVVGGLDGGAWTFDAPRHALIRISGPGEARSEVPLPRDEIAPGGVMAGMSLVDGVVRTARLGDRVVVPRRIGSGELQAATFWSSTWQAELVAVGPESGEVSTVVSLPEALGDMVAHFQGLGVAFPPFPLWYRLWAICGERELRLYDFRRNQVLGFAPDGTELDPIVLPPPPFTEATPRQFVRAAFDIVAAERAGAVTPDVGNMPPEDSAQLIQGAISRIEASPEQLGAVLPPYVDLRCDDEGALWLRPLDLERGGMKGGPGWIHVAADGTARSVRFPERFDPYRFTGGRAWGVQRDALDVAATAWVALPEG